MERERERERGHEPCLRVVVKEEHSEMPGLEMMSSWPMG